MIAGPPGLIWEIKKGDLVRLRSPGTQCRHKYTYEKGVVVSEIKQSDDQQLSIWPSVDVYIFQTGTIRECLAGSVEIISIS